MCPPAVTTGGPCLHIEKIVSTLNAGCSVKLGVRLFRDSHVTRLITFTALNTLAFIHINAVSGLGVTYLNQVGIS